MLSPETKILQKTKWYNFRRNLSTRLVRIARCVYPDNPEIIAFMGDLMTEHMIGTGAVKIISPEELYKKPSTFSLDVEGNKKLI